MIITKQKAAELIKNSNGKFLTVRFKKRSTGEARTMNCRTEVVSHLTGGGPSYNAADHNLLTVFDIKAGGYRSIPIEGLEQLKFGGVTLNVQG